MIMSVERKIELVYRGVVHAKKNSKQIVKDKSGRVRIISNATAKAGEEDMRMQFTDQLLASDIGFLKKRIYQNRAIALMEAKEAGEKYAIDFVVYAPNNIRRDLDNMVTSILDALTKANIIVDDSFQFLRAFSVRFGGIDKVNPRAEISITVHRDK